MLTPLSWRCARFGSARIRITSHVKTMLHRDPPLPFSVTATTHTPRLLPGPTPILRRMPILRRCGFLGPILEPEAIRPQAAAEGDVARGGRNVRGSDGFALAKLVVQGLEGGDAATEDVEKEFKSVGSVRLWDDGGFVGEGFEGKGYSRAPDVKGNGLEAEVGAAGEGFQSTCLDSCTGAGSDRHSLA
jgi:hypothetical protein